MDKQMTTERAIEVLKTIKEDNYNYVITSAMEVAIKALEKHIPMKAHIDERSTYLDAEPYDFIICPRCGADLIDEALEWEDIDDDEKIRKYCEGLELANYCYNCGQRLDVED